MATAKKVFFCRFIVYIKNICIFALASELWAFPIKSIQMKQLTNV